MFFLTKPDRAAINRFIAAQQSAQFSYSNVGDSRTEAAPSGYIVDHNRIELGSGIATFERAKSALQAWKMFAMPWVQLCWPNAPIVEKTNVAVLISHFGFWSLNAARIVYVVEDQNACARYGFAYGTLPDHAERGEERFTVEFHREDQSVWYDLLAFSRPNGMVRLAYPLARTSQKRFAADSKLAMKQAVRGI